MLKKILDKISKKDIRKLAKENDLMVKHQINSWGRNKEYNYKRRGIISSTL